MDCIFSALAISLLVAQQLSPLAKVRLRFPDETPIAFIEADLPNLNLEVQRPVSFLSVPSFLGWARQTFALAPTSERTTFVGTT